MTNALKIVGVLALMLCSISSFSQTSRRWEDIDLSGFHQCDTLSKHGYTLIFINKDSLLNSTTAGRLKDAFWKIYPKEVKRFNRKSLKTITIVVGTDYRGVAATLKGIVKIDENWLKKNPEDIDLLTHELMHVVQGYTYQVPAPWLTDGIADYARFAFGINNEKSGWTLTPYQAGQSYRNSYRIAARFLVWTEKHKYKHIVDRLNEALYKGTYRADMWNKLTGKSIDELWQEYGQNPVI